jgi:hypothetical protein
MIVYKVGEMIKIKSDTVTSSGLKLEKGEVGIILTLHPGRVEAAFEGWGLVSVAHDLIKRKTRKAVKLVKAKNVKLTDEVHLPGSGEYVKVGTIYRNEYDDKATRITVETVNYDSFVYAFDGLVDVRR